MYKEFYNTLIKLLGRKLPIIFILFIFLGFLLTILLERLDLAVRGLSIVIPIIVSSIFLKKFYAANYELERQVILFSYNQKTLVLIFSLFYVLSIYCRILDFSSFYIILLLLAYLFVFIQLFSRNCNSNHVLIESTFLMLNLIYGVTLKYPLFFGATDIIGHIFFSNVTYILGRVVPKDLDIYYAYFPLFHILISETSHILGLNIKSSYFLITAPIFAVSVIFVYYIFNQTTNNKQLSLLSALIYSTSSVVIFSGMYVITRTMAYLAFVLLLYFIYNPKRQTRLSRKICIIIISVFIVLVHHVSIPHIVVLMLILYICEKILVKSPYFSNNYILFIVVMSISYWIYVAYLVIQRLNTIYSNPLIYESLVIKSSIKPGNEWNFLFSNFDMSIFLFFAIIGIGYTFYKGSVNYSKIFCLFGFSTLIFYIPSPLQILWQTMTMFRFDRLILLVSPFMAFIMSAGICYFINYLLKTKLSKVYSIFCILFLFSAFVFTSLNASSESINIMSNSPHQYFTSEELIGFTYFSNYAPCGSMLFSDYYASRYFSFSQKFSGSNKLGIPYYISNIIKYVEDVSLYKGYIILRTKSFSDTGLLFGTNSSRYLYSYDNENQLVLENNLKGKDKIYSNSAIDILFDT